MISALGYAAASRLGFRKYRLMQVSLALIGMGRFRVEVVHFVTTIHLTPHIAIAVKV